MDFQKKIEYIFYYNLLGASIFIIQSILRFFGDFSWIFFIGDGLVIFTFIIAIIAIRKSNFQLASYMNINFFIMILFYYILNDGITHNFYDYRQLYNLIIVLCIGILINAIFAFSRKQIYFFGIIAMILTLSYYYVLIQLDQTNDQFLPYFSYVIAGGLIFTLVSVIANMFFGLSHDLFRLKEQQLHDMVKKKEAHKIEYKKLFHNIPAGVGYHKIILDDDGQPCDYVFLEINRMFQRLTGLKQDKIINRTITEILPKDEIASWIQIYGKVALNEETVSFEQFSKPLGKWYNVIAYSPQKYYFLTIFSDITEKKRKEKEMVKKQRISSISHLAGGIAHDFNNLLVGILGNIELLRFNESLNPSARDTLDDLERATQSANNLAKQLLTFAKGGVPNKKEINLYEIIEGSANLILNNHNFQMILQPEWQPNDSETVLIADPHQIYQVFINLFLNAIEANPTEKIIKVSTKLVNLLPQNEFHLSSGYYVSIIVQDFGKGIPKDIQEHIFEPYFTTKTQGNGLGLATIYSIIRKHQGYITFTSQENEGTSINIFLPLETYKITPKIFNSNQSQNDDRFKDFKGKILVLDDEPFIHKILAQMLHKLNINVDSTYDGRKTIEEYEIRMNTGNKYDAVILDLNIPTGLDGFNTIKQLQKIDPKIKAIVSSGYSSDPILEDYDEYGFVGKLNKPYTFSQLKQVLNQIIEH